jgi:hypothetical protein
MVGGPAAKTVPVAVNSVTDSIRLPAARTPRIQMDIRYDPFLSTALHPTRT